MKTKNTKKTKTEIGLQTSPVELLEKPPTTAPEAIPAPMPEVPAKRILPYVNYAERDANRSLPTDQVLATIRQSLPDLLPVAEVVGKWVWLTFAAQPSEAVRATISQLGFHWNNHRKCWQHPCGQFATEGSGQDPRTKYGTRMAA